ncbi:ubiquitin carboxyl-terminal hydrolase 42 isoform X2 [Parasteatoda tepidariorum]|uniref:ubiquitin carboxyl-terminal hydrolase 42 isoform X2 n=1 Tax=Parasteatoda tepidariorum TaxID=114398 RepID=UPI00077F9EA3|nr:ubiquitin carboxyl-terminal hydrolase 42 isoform X2 [Parasteatoda tepidariorum]
METTVSSRLSLLAAGAIDFCPSENKITSSTDSDGRLTAIFTPKDFQKHLVDQNKNSLNNGYITLNGNKEQSFVKANEERIRTSSYNGKVVEDGNAYITLNGNKEKCLVVNANKEKNVTINSCKERVVEDGIPIPKQIIYSGKIQLSWKQPRKIGAGLENMGNTCFMNTVVQCLTYCPPLVNHLLYDSDHSSKCTITGFCMMCVLHRHIKRALDNSNDVIRPTELFQRLRTIAKHFQHGRQEDAHEYLRYVIDNLWRSCLLQNNFHSKLDSASKETTIINQIFGGYHRSQVICSKCKERSNTFDHFMDFILDIKQNVLTLEAALKKFIEPENLDNDNAYKCPKCKMKVQACKRFTVHKAPNVATFQLKRFDYNRSFGGKITKQITYPQNLNLRPFMSDTKGEPVVYHLNAVLVHSGPTCNSGHYYCYVKNSDGSWYIMDDQRVHRVGINQVLNQIAYVLFYIKATPTESFPLKKTLENGVVCKKIGSTVCDSKKSEIPSSKPLIQNNQFRQSSPKLKQPTYPTVNLTKRNGLSPNVNNREKIAFGIRNPASKSQETNSTHVNTPKTENHQAGLVPYIEDSSDSSSDDNAIVKLNSNSGSSNSAGSNSLSSAKPECVSNFNIKRKPALNVNRLSNSGSSSSTSSKVIATDVWTVTNVRADSPGADSNSSVHSTTDWHVTSTDKGGSSVPKVVKQDSSGEDEKCKPACNLVFSSNQTDSTHNGLNENTKQHDFRKQESKHGNAFFAKEENCKESSTLKRKCSDSDQENPTNSKFCNGEDQPSSVPKKIQHETHFVNSDGPPHKKVRCETDIRNGLVIDLVSPNKCSKKLYSTELASQTAASPHKSFESPKKSDLEETKKERIDVSKNNVNCSSSSNSSPEYEWVEKTNDSVDRTFKGNHSYGKDEKAHFQSLNDKNKGQKFDVAKELTNNSKYFLGSSVPTWNGHSRHKEFDNEKRKSFSDYEDEYDRGKVRKFKSNNSYTHFRGHNPFQEYGKSFRGYNKYENRHYHGGRQDRFYNSHPKYKHNSHNNYRKHFKGK